jgi:hypothetical protein
MADIYCKYCNNNWKYKKDYEKHLACCEYFYNYRRKPEKEMDDYGCKLPTQKELFRFVQELSLKCSRLEQEVERLKRNVSVRHKKVISDCLNHPDQIPEWTFAEWWKQITLGIPYAPTPGETAEMNNHWSSIENPFLFRVFRRDLVDGIKYLIQQFIEGKKHLHKFPIRAFTQKSNVFYVYGENPHSSPTLSTSDKNKVDTPVWHIMTTNEFETMIDGISQLFVREFLIWQRDNMESIDENEARKDEQMTYMIRVNGLRPTKERGMADIRKWLFSTLEENAKTEFEFV